MLAFHFPQYLTTPELRRSYDVGVIRQIMFWAMVMAGSLALVNIIFNRSRWLSAFAFGLVALTVLLGGHSINVDPNFPDHTPLHRAGLVHSGFPGLVADLHLH